METRLRWQAMASLGLGIKLLLGSYAVALLLNALASALTFANGQGAARFDVSVLQRYAGANRLAGMAVAILVLVALALIARAPREAAVGPLAWGAFVVSLAGQLTSWSVYALPFAGVLSPSSSRLVWTIQATIGAGLWLVESALVILLLPRLARWLGKPLGAPMVLLLVVTLVIETGLTVGAFSVMWLPELPWRKVVATTACYIISSLLILLLQIGLVVATWLVLDAFRKQPKPAPRELPAPPPGLPPGAA